VSNETALATIESAAQNGSLIFFDRKNGFPQVELYRTEVTVLTINKDEECFEISKKFMPKREVVDRIGGASGVIFIKGETRSHTSDDPSCGKHTVFAGIAQGKVRMPDGTWRESSICEYEFDPTLRAMLDYKVTELTPETKAGKKEWTDEKTGKTKPYGSSLATAILEYQKTGRQRANTGARLRVIRELTGMPIAFTAEQLSKPMVFGRIVQNTSYILQTPEGRAMATAQALGVDIAALFGGRKMLGGLPDGQNANGEAGPENTATALAVEATKPSEPYFPDDPAEIESEDPKKIEFERLTQVLGEYLEGFADELNVTSVNGKNPYKMAEAELNNPNATVESRGSMIERLRKYLKEKGVNV
jgi:hypothetical protein